MSKKAIHAILTSAGGQRSLSVPLIIIYVTSALHMRARGSFSLYVDRPNCVRQVDDASGVGRQSADHVAGLPAIRSWRSARSRTQSGSVVQFALRSLPVASPTQFCETFPASSLS